MSRIKQPIAITDRFDGFGRSHYRFQSAPFEPLDDLTSLANFELEGSLAQCEFRKALLAYFDDTCCRHWMLFSTYALLESFVKYIRSSSGGGAGGKNDDSVVPNKLAESSIKEYGAILSEERVRELCEDNRQYQYLKSVCSAAPYIVVQLENILRTPKTGIFGVLDNQVAAETLKLTVDYNDEKASKRGGGSRKRKIDEFLLDCKSCDDDDELLGEKTATTTTTTTPMAIEKSTATATETASTADLPDDLQVFGVKVSVFAHNDRVLHLYKHDNSIREVRASIFGGRFHTAERQQQLEDDNDDDGGVSKNAQIKMERRVKKDVEKCNAAFCTLSNSRYPTKSFSETVRRDQKMFNLAYTPPLREQGKMFPLLTQKHSFRFELYDYQRRLLYWMIRRERQTLLFEAWPAQQLAANDAGNSALDQFCVPNSMLVTTHRRSDGYMLPGVYVSASHNNNIMRSPDTLLSQFCDRVHPELMSSAHNADRMAQVTGLFFNKSSTPQSGDASKFAEHGFVSSEIVLDASTASSGNIVVLDDDDDAAAADDCSTEGRCCLGTCSSVQQKRASLSQACGQGTEQCSPFLLGEAALRTAQVDNYVARQTDLSSSNKFVHATNPDLFRCGVSCGRTGCGKTTMKIALIYVLKQWEDAIPDSLRERSHGEQSTSFEALLPTHRRPLKLSDNMITTSLQQQRRRLYYANCTLVVCPEQVVEQWFMEFVKTIGSGRARERPTTGKRRGVLNGGVFGEIVDEHDNLLLQVAVVRDIHALRQLTLADIIERIDVLIVHQNLFKSPSYRSNTKSPLNAEFRQQHGRRPITDRLFEREDDTYWIKDAVAYERRYIQRAETALQDRMLSEAEQNDTEANFDFDSIPKPGFALGRTLLHAIHFRRAIIDEAHLLSAHVTAVERAVGELSADFWWCVTATANFDVAGAMQRFVARNEGGYGKLLHIPNDSHDVRTRTLLERNREYRTRFVRQCSATTSYEALPPLQLHRVPVTMTASEMAIYSSLRSGRQARMRRLMFCSHHMLNNAEWVEKNLAGLQESSSSSPSSSSFQRKNTDAVTTKLMTVDQVAAAMQSRRLDTVHKINAELLSSIDEFRTGWLSLRDATTAPMLCLATEQVDAEIECAQRLLNFATPVAPMIGNEDDNNDAPDDYSADTEKYEPENLSRVDPDRQQTATEKEDLQNENEHAKENEEEEEETEANESQGSKQPAAALVELAAHLDVNYLGEITPDMLDVWRNERDVRIAMALTRHDEQLSGRGISLRARYGHFVSKRPTLLRQRTRVLAEYAFFQNTFDRLSRPDESIECPICLSDEDTKNAIVLTVCGHEFCTECSKMLFRQRARCAVCRKDLRVPSDLRLVDRTAPAPTPPPQTLTAAESASTGDIVHNNNDETKNVRETYGSKLAALIDLIKRILARRDCKKIVLFAQFQRLLLLIAGVLRENGINFVTARGSIRSCEKAFRSFRSDASVRIILLASDKSISGVHLVEANHLIAVHPMLCSRGAEDEYAMLWQAIGRIRRLMQRQTCHVWQMVTTNTVEEQLYERQTAMSRKKQGMDIGITWNARETESADDENCNDGVQVAAPSKTDSNTEKTRLELIRLLNTSGAQQTDNDSDEGDEDESDHDDSDKDDINGGDKDDDDDDNDEEAGEPQTVEESFDDWLTTRSYRKRQRTK